MDAGTIARFRWRRRGNWMWPSFIALTVLDAVIGTALPPAGDGWAAIGAFLFAGFANLVAIVLLSLPLRWQLRRRRPDLPKVVAADYAGTWTMSAITVLLLVLGVLHQPGLHHDSRVKDDAIKRAQAYIGDHAPAQFRRNLQFVSTYTIDQRSEIYRVCVPSVDGRYDWCVVVHDREPFGRSVTHDGSTPNGILDEGTG